MPDPASLPGAIEAIIAGASALSAVNAGGGGWYGEAPAGTVAPYVVFTEIGTDFARKNTVGQYFPGEKFRFWTFGRTHDEARLARDALLATFNTKSARIPFADGTTLVASPVGAGMDLTEYDDDAGDRLRVHYVDIEFKTSRSFPTS